jgi:hypothetical protein
VETVEWKVVSGYPWLSIPHNGISVEHTHTPFNGKHTLDHTFVLIGLRMLLRITALVSLAYLILVVGSLSATGTRLYSSKTTKMDHNYEPEDVGDGLVKRGLSKDYDSFYVAAYTGRLDQVESLSKFTKPIEHYYAFKATVSEGHLECVRFFV